jgi:hypothetical protein
LQALLLGSAVLLLVVVVFRPDLEKALPFATAQSEVVVLEWLLAISSLLHVLMVWGEVSLTHPTAHARLAIWEMVRGRYRNDFWVGTVLSILGGLLPWLAITGVVSFTIGAAGSSLALIGLLLYENAYVQAGQSVPLA